MMPPSLLRGRPVPRRHPDTGQRATRPNAQRGDTLVEVTIALAILSLVLTGAFVAANRAYTLGQDAKERSQMVSDAQQQAEALESFRDSHNWTEFKSGSATSGYTGILNSGSATGGCASPCFHMVQATADGFNQWLPQSGPIAGDPAAQGSVSITAQLVTGSNPEAYTFTIAYGIPPLGGGPNLASTVLLRLTDLDLLRQ